MGVSREYLGEGGQQPQGRGGQQGEVVRVHGEVPQATQHLGLRRADDEAAAGRQAGSGWQ